MNFSEDSYLKKKTKEFLEDSGGYRSKGLGIGYGGWHAPKFRFLSSLLASNPVCVSDGNFKQKLELVLAYISSYKVVSDAFMQYFVFLQTVTICKAAIKLYSSTMIYSLQWTKKQN